MYRMRKNLVAVFLAIALVAPCQAVPSRIVKKTMWTSYPRTIKTMYVYRKERPNFYARFLEMLSWTTANALYSATPAVAVSIVCCLGLYGAWHVYDPRCEVDLVEEYPIQEAVVIVEEEPWYHIHRWY